MGRTTMTEDDSSTKYIDTEELEALSNPEKELKKCMKNMLSS